MRAADWRVAVVLVVAFGFGGDAAAEIATDGTVGPRLELEGPDFAIGEELGTRAGDNLFHSFDRFSLRNGESATFSGRETTRSVISRVTGGAGSEIDGTIDSTAMPGADFYFINPAGVLFGPNAVLNVPGSFHVSTADQLRFEGGEVFSADRSDTSSFSVATPEAFGFLDRNAGPIRLTGTALPVAPDRSLSLVGGDIVIDRSLIALRDPVTQNGNVTLVAMSRPGTVAVADGSTSAAPQGAISMIDGIIDVSSEAGGGVVRIRAGALDVSGPDPEAGFGVFADNLDGEPNIATALIDIEADRVGLDGAAIGSFAFGAGDAGDVNVRAGESMILNGAILSSNTFGSGNAGDVTVNTRELAVLNGAILSSDTFGPGDGNAGDVVVDARSITLRGGGRIVSRTRGGGLSGNIDIESDMVFLGRAGLICSNSEAFQLTELISGERGGSVRIDADIVTMRGEPDARAEISTTTLGGQDAGRVEIIADELRMSDAFISSTTLADTDAGPVRITVDRLHMSSAQIQSASLAGSVGRPEATGNGGRIFIKADQGIVLTGSPAVLSLIATPSDTRGDAGNIRMVSPQINLDSSVIISAAMGEGDAGAMTIKARDELVLHRGSGISTEALQASGGRISIQVGKLIDLQKSTIESNVRQEEGNAGDIMIDPDFLVLDDSQILARADAGSGGDISIVADNLLISPDSLINAEAGDEGVDGTVVTSEPAVDLASALVVLDAPLLDAEALLAEPCAARRDVGASSFIGVGRGGLPASPDQPLGSAYMPPAATALRPAVAGTLALPCAGTF